MARDEDLEIIKQGVEVWNQWRKHNPKLHPDLSNAKLSDMYLHHVDFLSTDLSFADLGGAKIFVADFSYANLISTNFRLADLRGACFNRARLNRANLYGTILYGTDFSFAILGEADFT